MRFLLFSSYLQDEGNFVEGESSTLESWKEISVESSKEGKRGAKGSRKFKDPELNDLGPLPAQRSLTYFNSKHRLGL